MYFALVAESIIVFFLRTIQAHNTTIKHEFNPDVNLKLSTFHWTRFVICLYLQIGAPISYEQFLSSS